MTTSVQKVFPAMGTVHTIAFEGEHTLSVAEQIKARMQRSEHNPFLLEL